MRASDLKNSILQLAISGKLVPQDPNDEPAPVLFDKIQAERKHLIVAGKIRALKSGAKPTPINPDAAPFQIPDDWIWVKLGDIADLYTGDSIPEIEKASKYAGLKEGYDYIGTKDVGFDNTISYDNGVRIPFDENGFKYAHPATILLCIEGGSAGRKIGILNRQVCFGNKLCAITALGFDSAYLYWFLQSDFFRSIFGKENSGIIGGVSIKKFYELSVPLPPLAEQKRIVDKIKELSPLVERYGAAAEELARIKTAFPDNLRKSILQYAIQGKLVPQNPADEPASVLLDKICAERVALVKAGKIKPSKPPKINEHFLPPFPIPDNWAWVTLSELGLVNPRNTIPDDLEVSFIPMDKISGQYGNLVDVSGAKKWADVKQGFTHLQDGDVIMAKITPCFENQKSAILHDMINGYGAGTTELHTFRNLGNVCAKYILLFLKSPYFMMYAAKNMTGTAGQQRVPTEIFANYPMPLPPLAEQRRIVAKVDDLMKLCENLGQFINQSV
jgi:type I restriction enzyme S subunit